MNNNKHKILKYAVPVILAALMAFIIPQRSILEQLDKNLETWRTNYSPEKIYLHHDKPYYTAGQNVWLKGYALDAATLRPSLKSRVLYVDLLDADNEPVRQLTLKVENGRTHGDIALPDDLPGGIYRLVAHTKWARNFGEETFFNKAIRIVDETGIAKPSLPPSKEIDLQFFPEGGDLVNNISSRVAFKATGPNGLGMPINGTLFDDRGVKILDFNDLHLGMGAFTLRPEKGRHYFAKVNLADGTTTDYPLPLALRDGYVLSVNETTDPEYVDVIVKSNITSDSPLVLTAISRDAVKFSKLFTVNSGRDYHDRIAKALFPSGISRFNLATASGEPLAERLVFIDRKDNLNIKVSTDKPSYIAREQVIMRIEAKDIEGNPVATDFSLAITDDELVRPDRNGLTIQSYLLLSSDLRGHVEQPGYYFENNASERSEALSYLLMTQGWRRFAWKDAVTGTFPPIDHMNETSLTIRGKLVTNKGEPVKKGEALLYLKGKHESFIITETNEQGVFNFDGFDFSDSVDMVIQGTDARGRRKHLEIKMDNDRFLSRGPAFVLPSPDYFSASTGQDFVEVSNKQITSAQQVLSAQTLEAIMLKDVIIEERAEIINTFRLHDRADVVLMATDLPPAPTGNILESLQGRVAGLQVIRVGPNDFHARIRGQGPPLYLIDGIPISESTLSSINQFDIGRIEILKNRAAAAIYGGRASYGVVALYTRTGAEEFVEVQPAKYIIIHRAGGYSKTREFYSPRYGDTAPGDKFPDLRTTLYWNPNVKTNDDGIATITFFTADRNTSYRAIVEGISDKGNPGRTESTFAVEFEEGIP